MGYQHLEIEHNGHVATLWLNRPEKRNALSEDMWADIPSAVADLDSDKSVRVIILASRGSAFSVGIDLNMLAGLHPKPIPLPRPISSCTTKSLNSSRRRAASQIHPNR